MREGTIQQRLCVSHDVAPWSRRLTWSFNNIKSKAYTPTMTLISSTLTSFFALFDKSWKVRYAPVSLSMATTSASITRLSIFSV